MDTSSRDTKRRGFARPDVTRRTMLALSASAGLAALPTGRTALAQQPPPGFQPAPEGGETFNVEEIVDSGHRFFGSASRGLALAVQDVFQRWGRPNGYILGQEAAGAFFGGLRYGEGKLYTRGINTGGAGERNVFWQGPSLGFDFGGSGNRTMILVYHLPSIDHMFQRFAGLDGSAYLVAGFAVSALGGRGENGQDVLLVPIRTGVGLKLGINIGYLKFTPQATWNPF
ncbi:MAG: DUF1134 domain-containing protein [Pseudochelatococcus sp.]|jgi:hypothetical protein|uniref:DUF1134 domain-containing protein n=1 Tax=Pseudochelatococcus sp. TaxID=2020869 RepID=UPI003D8B2B5D